MTAWTVGDVATTQGYWVDPGVLRGLGEPPEQPLPDGTIVVLLGPGRFGSWWVRREDQPEDDAGWPVCSECLRPLRQEPCVRCGALVTWGNENAPPIVVDAIGDFEINDVCCDACWHVARIGVSR